MKLTALLKLGVLVLITLVLVGGSAMTPGAEAQANTSHVAAAGVQAEPPSQGIPPTYMEVVGQLDMRNFGPNPETGYVLQETIIVPVDGSSVSSTMILKSGVLYRIKASGTFYVGGWGDQMGDAEYADLSNPPSSINDNCGGTPDGVDLGIGINDSINDNEKFPSWGNFEPSHVYTIDFAGQGSSISLNYHDCAYNDNFGSLAVEVWLPAASAWHVATTGSDTTGNGSEAQPFATIQHGIDAASPGDTVLAHPGVYRENINFGGKNITVGSLFITTGDEDYILQTVIDGNRNGRVVTFVNGEVASAKLSGFTITNGYAKGVSEPESYGGGIYTRYSSPTLTHLRVTGNEAVEEGGGLHIRDSSPTVRDIIVTNNHADGGGGGIRYTGGSVSLENVVVSQNSARTGGSGLFFYHADGTINNALIADNSGDGPGGGLVFDGCSPTFINVTIVGNRTTGHGGGLNVSFMSQPTLVNSIVWGNTPEQIYFDTNWPGEAITIEYSNIQGGQAGIVTNGQGPVYWGNGNLETSPRFVRAGLGNYRLANNSSCIGAGKVVGAPSTDIEGNPRPNPAGSNPDMGAYENPLGPPPPSTFKVYLPFMHNAPRSAEGLYFVRGDVLYQMNLDGSDLRSVADGLQDNQSLAADPIHRKIYAGRWGQSAQIRVFDVTSGDLMVFSDGPGDGGQGLAIDPAGHKMYHGLYYGGVHALDMNIAGAWTQLVDPASLSPMYGQRGQLQVDPVNRHIYFRSTFNGDCGLCRYIWRVGYDGGGLVKIIQANGGDALALDLTEQKMYFSDVPDEPASNTVKRASLDGSVVETLLTLPAPYRLCTSMALDVEHQKMYLNLSTDGGDDYKGKAIARANMDGSGFEFLHTVAGNTESEVHGLMALLLPVAPALEPPLLVRYDFEGDFLAAGTVLDRSGNGRNAQVTGAVASTPGISGGQGIAFTGNGYLQAASNPVAGKTDVTFSLWFKTAHPGELTSWPAGPGGTGAPAPAGSWRPMALSSGVTTPRACSCRDNPTTRTISPPASGSTKWSPMTAAASRNTPTVS